MEQHYSIAISFVIFFPSHSKPRELHFTKLSLESLLGINGRPHFVSYLAFYDH